MAVKMVRQGIAFRMSLPVNSCGACCYFKIWSRYLVVQIPVSCKNVFYHYIDCNSFVFVYFPAGRFLIRLVMVAYPFVVSDAYYRTIEL